MNLYFSSLLTRTGLGLVMLLIMVSFAACTQSSTQEFQEQQNNLFQPHPEGIPTFKSDTTTTDSSA